MLLLGFACLGGCSLTKPDAIPTPAELGKNASNPALSPDRCGLKVVIASRPADDPLVRELLWHSADEQVIDPDLRAKLEANGLRLGKISGDLPSQWAAVLDAPPPQKLDPLVIVVPSGESTVIDTGAVAPTLTLLLNRQGKVAGKDYTDAKGHVRLIPTRTGNSAVALRIVPELHHGPVRQGWSVAPGGSPLAPQQLIVRNGQQEETFRDLGATIPLEAGQLLVLSAWSERDSSLGKFLFTQPDAATDHALLKVMFIWARRVDELPETSPAQLASEDSKTRAHNRTRSPGQVQPALAMSNLPR
jgi:hypothetical protein